MNKTLNAFVITLLIVAGLIGAAVSSKFFVTQPAEAQTNTTRKWESRVEGNISSWNELQGRTSMLGEQG